MPAAVGRHLRSEGHETWTAHEAHLEAATDAELIAYADDHDAVVVTTNVVPKWATIKVLPPLPW